MLHHSVTYFSPARMLSWFLPNSISNTEDSAESVTEGFHPIDLSSLPPVEDDATPVVKKIEGRSEAPATQRAGPSPRFAAQTSLLASEQGQTDSGLFGGMKLTRRARHPNPRQPARGGAETPAMIDTTSANFSATPAGSSATLSSRADEVESRVDSFLHSRDPDGATVSGAESAASVSHVRDKVEQIYLKHDPGKLGEIDKVLSCFKGREAQLLDHLRECYAPTSASPSPTTSPARVETSKDVLVGPAHEKHCGSDGVEEKSKKHSRFQHLLAGAPAGAAETEERKSPTPLAVPAPTAATVSSRSLEKEEPAVSSTSRAQSVLSVTEKNLTPASMKRDSPLAELTRLDHLLGQLTSLVSTRATAVQSLAQLNERLADCVARASYEEADLVQREVSEAEKALTALDARIRDASATLTTTGVDSFRAQAFLSLEANNKKAAGALAQRLAHVREKIEIAQRERHALQRSLEACAADAAQSAAEEEEAARAAESAELCNRENVLQQSIANAQSLADEGKGHLAREVADLSEEIQQTELRLVALKAAYAAKLHELQDLEATQQADIAAQQSELAAVRDALQQRSDKQMRCRNEREAMEQQHAELAAADAQLQAEVDALQTEEKEYEKTIEAQRRDEEREKAEVVPLVERALQGLFKVLEERTQNMSAVLKITTPPPTTTTTTSATALPAKLEEDGEVDTACKWSSYTLNDLVQAQKHYEQRLQAISVQMAATEEAVKEGALEAKAMEAQMSVLQAEIQAAVGLKRFKEAQLKSDELKRLTQSHEAASKMMAERDEALGHLHRQMVDKQKAVASVSAALRDRSATYAESYKALLAPAPLDTPSRLPDNAAEPTLYGIRQTVESVKKAFLAELLGVSDNLR